MANEPSKNNPGQNLPNKGGSDGRKEGDQDESMDQVRKPGSDRRGGAERGGDRGADRSGSDRTGSDRSGSDRGGSERGGGDRGRS